METTNNLLTQQQSNEPKADCQKQILDKRTLLLQKINNARRDMSIEKDNMNKFGGFKFRNIESIFEKLVPVCIKNKLSYSITEENISHLNNTFIYTFISKFVDIETNEEMTTQMSVPYVCFEKKGMDTNQTFGAFVAYNRKYLVCRDFQIRSDISELDSDEDVNMIMTLINQSQTIEELQKIKPKMNLLQENANKQKIIQLMKERYNEIQQQNNISTGKE